MKAKRYKIMVYDGVLAMMHGCGHAIDEISVGGMFINHSGVHLGGEDRFKRATSISEIEFDEMLCISFKRFAEMHVCIEKEINRILTTKGDVKCSKLSAPLATLRDNCCVKDAPIFCWDDFERKYLPRSRKERLEALETPEEKGKRLAKEALEKIRKDLKKTKKKR